MTYNAFIIYGFSASGHFTWKATFPGKASSIPLAEWLSATSPAEHYIDVVPAGGPEVPAGTPPRTYYVGFHLHNLCDFAEGTGAMPIPQHLELPEHLYLRLSRLRQALRNNTDASVGSLGYFLVGNVL